MNSLCFQSSCFSHSLCRSSCWSSQKNSKAISSVSRNNTVCGSCLSCSRSTCKHHHLGCSSKSYSITLYIVIGHANLFLYSFHINRKVIFSTFCPCFHEPRPQSVRTRCGYKLFHLAGNTNLSIIKRWQINSLYWFFILIQFDYGFFLNQILFLKHLIHGHNDIGFLCFQKL